jgi:hypothetical protein
MAAGNLYFHSPCFDGIVSAVLAWDFLEAKEGWTNPTLRQVNYDIRDTWLAQALHEPASVVDFLYHPMASFWADHHLSTFLTDAARQDFLRPSAKRLLIYDSRFGSCAALLWERFYKSFNHRTLRFQEIVEWADKIDSASYSSIEEVIHPTAPALQLNLTLTLQPAAGYCETLVRDLRNRSLRDVTSLPGPRSRFEQASVLLDAGLSRFKQNAYLDHDGVVVFDVDTKDVIVSRYAPFHFFPDARYSIGITRWPQGGKITAMRNPWKAFQSVPLGKIAEKLGGGGHQRVGSIILRGTRLASARSLLNRFLDEMRRLDKLAPEND